MQANVEVSNEEGEEEEDKMESEKQRESSTVHISQLGPWSDSDAETTSGPKINVDMDFGIAKRYLQKLGIKNETVWNHLQEIINFVLKDKSPDSMRYFEEISRDIRMKKYIDTDDLFSSEVKVPPRLREAEHLLRYYRQIECLYETADPSQDVTAADKDFLENSRLLIEAGIGIPKNEVYHIYLAMRRLSIQKPLSKIRLWGKVLGTMKNYYILEALSTEQGIELRKEKLIELKPIFSETQLKENHVNDIMATESPLINDVVIDSERMADDKMRVNFDMPIEENKNKSKLETYTKPPLPEHITLPEVIVPIEEPGTGANMCLYYVANDPTRKWEELPEVTPLQIQRARQIHRLFTGNLDAEFETFPKFPGNESNLLRAQIARISASTHVSPVGFYTNGGEEEMVELEEGTLYMENPDYEPPPVSELLNPSLEFWVHHVQFLLNQGTTTFWLPPLESGAEEGPEEDANQPEREVPPEILRALEEDVSPEAARVWRTEHTSKMMSSTSAVCIRSNLWPGAVTINKGKYFLNLYSGRGIKFRQNGYQPYLPAEASEEYTEGPEVMEMMDPSVETEELRWQLLHPEPINYGEEGMGEEEGNASGTDVS